MSSPLQFSTESVRFDRREFLGALSGLVLIASVSRIVKAADAPKYGADGMPHGWRDDPLTFVAIGEDGVVTVVVHRSEMGQGVRSGLPLIIADELEADWSRVRVVQAPADEEKYGNQDTDGSRSVRHFFDPMRRCGAAARAMLEAAAAATWNVPVSSVRAENHEVIHAESGRKLGYGALARAAAKLPVPPRESLRLKNPAQFRYIGKDSVPLLDGADISTGRAQYGIDVRLDGMLYAVVARSPVFGGKVTRFDAAQALAIPGVVKVIEIPGTPPPMVFQPLNGVAVVANDTWTAIKGRQALKIDWNDGEHGSYDSAAYRAEMQQASRKPGKVLRQAGDFDAAMEKAAQKGGGGVLPPASRARHDGAAERNSAHREWSLRSVGADPGTASNSRRCRETSRSAFREGNCARHAARRRLRPQVQDGLRHRSGAPVATDGRPAGESRLDAGRRPASRLLSHRLRRTHASGTGRAGQTDGVAASQRCAQHRGDSSDPIQDIRRRSSRAWA